MLQKRRLECMILESQQQQEANFDKLATATIELSNSLQFTQPAATTSVNSHTTLQQEITQLRAANAQQEVVMDQHAKNDRSLPKGSGNFASQATQGGARGRSWG